MELGINSSLLIEIAGGILCVEIYQKGSEDDKKKAIRPKFRDIPANSSRKRGPGLFPDNGLLSRETVL
jgi:hypothetical protein